MPKRILNIVEIKIAVSNNFMEIRIGGGSLNLEILRGGGAHAVSEFNVEGGSKKRAFRHEVWNFF